MRRRVSWCKSSLKVGRVVLNLLILGGEKDASGEIGIR